MTDFKRPIPNRQNELLRKNLSAPAYDLDSLSDKAGRGSNLAREASTLKEIEFPIEGLVNDNKPPRLLKDKVNRANVTRRDDDTTNDVAIGLQDHDEAIAYYFDKVIQPSIVKNGQRVSVPLVYGSPERWKSMQKDTYLRDKKGAIMMPIIVFKRDNMEKNRSLANKLDANMPNLYTSFQKSYNNKNFYSNFNLLNNRVPTKQFIANVVPDYVNLTYSCIAQTYYVEQLNKIIEAINYASDSYWGDPERFKFRARIDSFATVTELQQSQERLVRGTFQLKMYGYIVPDVIQKDLSSIKKYNDKSKIIFSMETDSAPQKYEANPTVTPDGRTRLNLDGENTPINIKDSYS